MSITSALANAFSGMTAASRTAEIISDNVANALTEGYSRREIDVTSVSLAGQGAGVRVEGVTRVANPRATAERRQAEADLGRGGALAAAQARISAALGEPGDPGSLAARAVAFETDLRALADTPESPALQAQALGSSADLVRGINLLSTETSRIRMDADASIAREVSTLNDSLRKIEALNAEIRIRSLGGGNLAALEEQRQQLIDTVSSMIPIRSARREDGAIALYTGNGAVLLEGRASEIGFSPTRIITPDMTLASGALSGLTLNGRAITIGQPAGGGQLDGGSLGAHFQIRDDLAPEFSAQADGYARDLVERLQDPAVDPTLLPGDAGLFTDSGNAFAAADELGLAERLKVNAAVDPANGGELWRLRDGLNAAAPGLQGENGILRSMIASITEQRTPPAGLDVVGSFNATSLAERLSAVRSHATSQAETASAYQEGRYTMLRETEASFTGVNTDQELSNLLLVEQAYSANARVMEVVDSLMRRLLEI